jgi:hypothetical protein
VPTLETAYDGRKGERKHLQDNIKTKLEQLNLSKTDPSMWL